MRIFHLLILTLGFLAGAAQAQVVYREVVVTGFGIHISEAVVDGLENAIAQVTGQRLSSSVSLRISETTQDNNVKLDESFQRNVEKATRGVVKSYTVLDSGMGADSRAYAKIRAVIPSYKPSDQIKRLKLAVAPLSINGRLASDRRAIEFAESVSAALEAHLTQTRKFAMLDRRFTATSERELQRFSKHQAPLEETVKVGARVGADYIVLASLREFDFQARTEPRVAGRVVERLRVPVTIDVRVIDIATGQVKFAQSYNHPGRLPSGQSLEQYAIDIGSDIGQVINFAIYPIAVLSANGGHLTLNQGGQTVQVGRVYSLVRLGPELTDPYTRESLGPEETEVGRIEVTGATDRTATARLLGGELPPVVKPGMLRVRLLPDEPMLSVGAGAAVGTGIQLPQVPALGVPAPMGKDKDW